MTDFLTLGKTIDTFIKFETFPANSLIMNIILESSELIAQCPITKQPDIYMIKIDYIPDKVCLETKTLKLYLMEFKNKGIFAENLACEICDALYFCLNPKSIKVTLVQNIRGGIITTVISEKRKDVK